jgi:hypothetical protein
LPFPTPSPDHRSCDVVRRPAGWILHDSFNLGDPEVPPRLTPWGLEPAWLIHTMPHRGVVLKLYNDGTWKRLHDDSLKSNKPTLAIVLEDPDSSTPGMVQLCEVIQDLFGSWSGLGILPTVARYVVYSHGSNFFTSWNWNVLW